VNARRLVEGIELMLGLRDADPGGSDYLEPFAWGRRFAAAWCGMSERQARTGIDRLKAEGVLVKAAELPSSRGRRSTPLYAIASA
jgi:hypothetical protein